MTETLAAGFGAVAKLRGARAVHSHGPAFEAQARLDALPGVPALARARGEVEATVRLSRSFGFPEPAPDVLGIAVRLHDLHGEGAHQDVLIVSCLPGPIANPVPLPAGSYAWPTYSSLLPLRLGDQLALLGARSAAGHEAREGSALAGARRAVAAHRLRFTLTWAPVGGRWRSWGEVDVAGPELATERAEGLRMDPVLHSGPGMRLAGDALTDLRARAYRRSRDARPIARA